jgi:NADPH:quinone reductase-like Zn-dependent oxidoreductase
LKAFEIQQAFGLENLKLTERPDPQPGPGQALVKMKACSLNYRDLLMVKGLYNPKQPLPLIPLSDGAGEVTAVGEGCTLVKTGERVAGIFAQKWIAGDFNPGARKSTLGGPLDGTLCEQRVFDQEGLVKIPDSFSYEEAATLPCAAVTAAHAMLAANNNGQVKSVLVLGTGGVSIFSLQLAKANGWRVIITSSSDEKLERAKALGADEIINYKKVPDWDKRVSELTDGQGVDYVVEVGGADTINKSINSVRFGGLIALIGILGGVCTDLMLTSVLMKGIRIQGILVGHRNMFLALIHSMDIAKIKPVIDRVFPFDQAPQAFALMESAKHFGKIVISF